MGSKVLPSSAQTIGSVRLSSDRPKLHIARCTTFSPVSFSESATFADMQEPNFQFFYFILFFLSFFFFLPATTETIRPIRLILKYLFCGTARCTTLFPIEFVLSVTIATLDDPHLYMFWFWPASAKTLGRIRMIRSHFRSKI